MDHKAYTEFCKSIESVPENPQVDQSRLETAMNLVITSNKLLDLLKKDIFYSKDINNTEWLNNLRDVNVIINDAMEDHRKCMSHNNAPKIDYNNFDIRLTHAIIGISTEAGELMEAMHRAVVPSSDGELADFDTVNFGEELGDMQWYSAIGMDAANLTLDGVIETNQTKLSARFSSGSFSVTDANERTLDVEREILETGFKSDDSITEGEISEKIESAPETKSKTETKVKAKAKAKTTSKSKK